MDFGQLSMNFNHAYKAYVLVSANDKKSYLMQTPKLMHRGKNAWMQIVIELWFDYYCPHSARMKYRFICLTDDRSCKRHVLCGNLVEIVIIHVIKSVATCMQHSV